ncbi:hypothetical protein BH24ACT22_BH24ACT22_02380 [soil metagenome]
MLSRVAIVGAGPGGVAAARRLKECAGDGIEVTLFEGLPAAEYLPATIPVFLGRSSREEWRTNISIKGVTTKIGEVHEVSGEGVKTNREFHRADAVIAAPGLALDHGRVPRARGVDAFWSPEGAESAAALAAEIRGGTIAIVVSSLPYRCPPAPYGMAMELATQCRRENRDVQVILTTPEETPLASLGGGVPEFLQDSCAAAGVELLTKFEPDLKTLSSGELRSHDGDALPCDAIFVVPPHVRSPLLAGLPGDGPLVQVSSRFESAEPGLFVVGDAAMTSLPRAADVAAAAGRTAVDAVLERLGLLERWEPHSPQPECYVGHGGGTYSRISLRYPDGPPPQGEAEISIEKPSEELGAGFRSSFDRWRALLCG